ncbi:DUF262 domain-containing protein [Paraclostridium tenue]|uniref:DUF262 domain-containing protein n=1 Tax=Paraclostridium tenue TaxID=1737 RepID=A0ABP3XGQ7_9FIRM
MSSSFKKPITIKEAIDNIHSREYLLPAIQRKFTWTSTQIEMLFDSILRGYPINSFMFWSVESEEIKCNYKFYEFLNKYREFFHENNIDIDTAGINNFKAVIDGQQRLTSLYIGLHGSYAYKMPRKWWKDDEDSLPTRKLYLNIGKLVNQEYDTQKLYDFRFLSERDLDKYSNDKNYIWFEVRTILRLNSKEKVEEYIKNQNLQENAYAYDVLFNLFRKIHEDKLINYYLEEEQEPDKVLEIFIRTNSGGTPLHFSDLLMSIASANWKKIDARKEIDDLVTKVNSIGRPGFIINKDFILKTCLVLFTKDIRFQLKNFGHDNVKIFEDNWFEIKNSIISAFELVERIGFNDKTFRAKNAAIPIIYYIYYNNLSSKITSATYDKEDKSNIRKWLNLTFIKSIFGGQPDRVLVTIRRILEKNLGNKFPLEEIIDKFKNDPSKNYSMEDDLIEGLLNSQYESNETFYILSLLYPNLDYYNQDFHKDHMHPASVFNNENKLKKIIPSNSLEFARDKNNWNSILNLQLINGRLNESKQDKSLKQWALENNILNEDLYVDSEIELDIEYFEKFIRNRKEKLKNKIRSLV